MLIYLDLTVADGTLNALILYANIVRIHHAIIFPPGHTNIVTVLLAWLNLDLGIEVCFYDGFDAHAHKNMAAVYIPSVCLDHNSLDYRPWEALYYHC